MLTKAVEKKRRQYSNLSPCQEEITLDSWGYIKGCIAREKSLDEHSEDSYDDGHGTESEKLCVKNVQISLCQEDISLEPWGSSEDSIEGESHLDEYSNEISDDGHSTCSLDSSMTR
jgi:hypothetical protein